MIERISTVACPKCGHRGLWQAVEDGHVVRECCTPGCGWWVRLLLPVRR